MLGNGKAKAGAAGFPGMALVHPVEPLKNPCVVLFRNADAGILDNHAASLYSHNHLTVILIVTDSIVTQIVNQFIGPLTNAGYLGFVTMKLHGDITLVCRRDQGLQHL